MKHRDLSNPYYTYWRSFLSASASWSRTRIVDYQLQELRRVVTWAYELTPAYRRRFDDAGVSPETLYHLSDIRLFPFLEKRHLRDGLEDHSVGLRGRYYRATGGSTGVPVRMYHTPRAFGRELASKAHQYQRIGWKEGDRKLVMRGLVIPQDSGIEFVEDLNTLRCSSYLLTPSYMERYYRAAKEFRPDWLRCYPSSGYVFAKFLEDRGYTLPVYGVLCASEPLYEFQRVTFERVFSGARVFSHYGHYEMAALAGYCEANSYRYHVLPHYGYVELLDEDDNPVVTKGQTGEIVATSFIMEATPIIRYRTGDHATYWGPGCEMCSRPYQVWENVDGRTQDYIVTRTGRHLTGTMLNDHDNTYDDLVQFQFYQNEPGVVVFRYIPKLIPMSHGLGGLDAFLRRQLRRKLGDDVKLVLEKTDQISRSVSGKHRFILQESGVQ